MTEQKEKPAKSSKVKATKEEREEANEIINRLQESGEYSRLQEQMLLQILTDHPQWFDEMRRKARETIQQKDGGILDITLDELSMNLIPTGEDSIPDELKMEFLATLLHNSCFQAKTTSFRR